MHQAMKTKMRDRKIRTLAIFAFACLFAVVVSKTFKWFVEVHHSDVPSFIRNIFIGVVLVPLIWAGVEAMDALKNQEEPELPDDKNI